MAELDYGPAPARALDLATKAYVDVGVPTFAQQAAPTYTAGPYVWYQTNTGGQVTQVWVESAGGPDTVAGLTYRLRVSDLTSYSNGQAVPSVAPQVGSAVLSSGGGTTSPTYLASGQGGRPALRFDGGDDYLANGSAPAVPQPVTYVLVLDVKSVTGTREFLYTDLDVVINDGSTAYNAYAGIQVSGGTPTTGIHSAAWVYNGASSAIYVDNLQVAAGNVGAAGGTQLQVARHPTAGRYAQIDLYELCVYSRALTPADVQAIHTYYRNQYGA